jgi:SPP1 gp7 family putative phage head morphogenesis protein
VYAGISRDNIKKIREIIADYYLEGRKFGETSREIVRLVEDLDIERAGLIVRTEMSEAIYQQSLNKYRKIGIKEVEMVVALDDQTCDICRALSGKQFPINDPPKIPVHEGCRCIIVCHIDHSQDEEDEEE